MGGFLFTAEKGEKEFDAEGLIDERESLDNLPCQKSLRKLKSSSSLR